MTPLTSTLIKQHTELQTVFKQALRQRAFDARQNLISSLLLYFKGDKKVEAHLKQVQQDHYKRFINEPEYE